MLVDDLGLDACWPLFVALSEAFELSLIGLAPRSMVVAGWQQCSNYWCCDSLCWPSEGLMSSWDVGQDENVEREGW
jgi:hypothetical protein